MLLQAFLMFNDNHEILISYPLIGYYSNPKSFVKNPVPYSLASPLNFHNSSRIAIRCWCIDVIYCSNKVSFDYSNRKLFSSFLYRNFSIFHCLNLLLTLDSWLLTPGSCFNLRRGREKSCHNYQPWLMSTEIELELVSFSVPGKITPKASRSSKR